MLKHFYFVRHGQTDWNVVGKLQGQQDIPLNDEGILQAKEVAERLYNLGVNVECIYSSPLMRAHKTAEIIASKLGFCVEVNPLLKEMNFGCFEGKIIASLPEEEKETFHRVAFAGPFDEKYADLNVENCNQVVSRFHTFIENLPLDKDNIMLVSHGAFIKSVIKPFLAENIFITNCACISFDYDFETEKLSNIMCI